ncbi:hypothetical protein UFOVP155_3 [uncultured Caudovirales phage]|uniref:Uncharacterized protein n=1 Tax=uncultured Caudovirales phage TaxID=2100421 RepID=A0A6J7W8G1_9CAUD|nr:hypothetical protein UFOVP155_3 [uncultured Caudovirales phage]
MSSDICVQLRERGEHVAAEFIELLSKRFVDEERRADLLEKAYAEQQQVWSDAIARADRYKAALREIIMCWNYEQCAELARAALGEKKDG